MRKFFKISLVVFAVAILAGEVVLSQIGFGKPPLYKSDKDFEYINIPNQKIDTLAFNYETNQYSMRGKTIGEIERERESDFGRR